MAHKDQPQTILIRYQQIPTAHQKQDRFFSRFARSNWSNRHLAWAGESGVFFRRENVTSWISSLSSFAQNYLFVGHRLPYKPSSPLIDINNDLVGKPNGIDLLSLVTNTLRDTFQHRGFPQALAFLFGWTLDASPRHDPKASHSQNTQYGNTLARTWVFSTVSSSVKWYSLLAGVANRFIWMLDCFLTVDKLPSTVMPRLTHRRVFHWRRFKPSFMAGLASWCGSYQIDSLWQTPKACRK